MLLCGLKWEKIVRKNRTDAVIRATSIDAKNFGLLEGLIFQNQIKTT